MTKLDSILKSRDITLSTNVCLVKAMVFPLVMYGCESWSIKKAEHQRIDAFETVVLEKTLESPLDCKQIQQSILKEISPGCSPEGLMLKLKFQYFGHLMQRTDSFEKSLANGLSILFILSKNQLLALLIFAMLIYGKTNTIL